MKKSVITLFLLALIAFGSVAQTIRRCNNNPGITGVNMYITIQAAHNAAVAGDIIYVEPSTSTYGNLDARKRLTIIGNGYFNDKNPNTSFDTRISKIDAIIFNNGTANSNISGVDVQSPINVNDINVIITRCKLSAGCTYGQSTNLISGLYSRGNSGSITKCIIGVLYLVLTQILFLRNLAIIP